MAEPIGYQSGIVAAMNRLRALDPAGKPAYDKLERTLRILAADHDAAIVKPTPPPPPPPPPPPTVLPAPQTYNKGSRGQDARYCIAGLSNANGVFTDAKGYRYDGQGLELDGRRSGNPVAGLKPADEMDGRDPCDPYNGMPPWPAGSYLP
jgi:hypothetical protein